MLSDLVKYISNDCSFSEKEQFIKYILRYCRNQSVKQCLIDGIRGNSTDLMYDSDVIFEFFDYSEHVFDIFDGSESDVPLPLLAYFYCMFEEGEFSIQTTCSPVIDLYDYYIGCPCQLSRSSRMVEEIVEVIKNNSSSYNLEKAIDNEDPKMISEILYESGWEEWYIDTTEISFSENIKKRLPNELNQLIQGLGLGIDENLVGYYWRITAGGEQTQYGDPEKDITALLGISDEIRKLLGRNNSESDMPYKDVIRVFEETGENDELILAVSSIHESKREVLF
nr:MAG TPA: hypothetical protein [Bacteriophage sp.]